MSGFTSLSRVSIAAVSLCLFQSHPASALGLWDAYIAALQHDPVYHSAVHENEAGQYYAGIGRSSLLPTVAINYATAKVRADVTAPGFFGTPVTTHPNYRSETQSISLRQSIINTEGVARYRQGLAQTEYSDAKFDGQKQEIIIRLFGAYADAQYAEKQLTLAQAQRDAFAEQLQLNTRLFKQGEGTKTDMLETQAKLDLADAQVIEAQDALRTVRHTLAAIIGIEVESLDPLSDHFKIQASAAQSFEEWKTTALKNNAEITMQRNVVKASQQDVEKNRAGHMPRLDMIASVGKNDSDAINTYNQRSTVRSIGVQLNIPLYSGGYVTAATQQAAANSEKANDDLEAITLKTLVELRKQYDLASSSQARIHALIKSVASASELIEATRKSVSGGIRINLDILNAQQQLTASKRDLAQAQYTYLSSYLRLRFLAGVLSEKDLKEIAAIYFVAKMH
ncbi:MAG: TolC family outer membrane protein [Pseudomonadota bacterium]